MWCNGDWGRGLVVVVVVVVVVIVVVVVVVVVVSCMVWTYLSPII